MKAAVLRRSIANRTDFINSMGVDIAMGGSSNTVLHLLAAAQEAGVDFDMSHIDELSRKTPFLCKVAPATNKYHIEDVHRAGGMMAIIRELGKAGLVDLSVDHVAGCPLYPFDAAAEKGRVVPDSRSDHINKNQ